MSCCRQCTLASMEVKKGASAILPSVAMSVESAAAPTSPISSTVTHVWPSTVPRISAIQQESVMFAHLAVAPPTCVPQTATNV